MLMHWCTGRNVSAPKTKLETMEEKIQEMLDRAVRTDGIVRLQPTFVNRLMLAVDGIHALCYSAEDIDYHFMCKGRQMTKSMNRQDIRCFMDKYFSQAELAYMTEKI